VTFLVKETCAVGSENQEQKHFSAASESRRKMNKKFLPCFAQHVAFYPTKALCSAQKALS